VGGVAGDGDATLRECWRRVVAKVEDCPLSGGKFVSLKVALKTEEDLKRHLRH
jgi:hypothetical protein